MCVCISSLTDFVYLCPFSVARAVSIRVCDSCYEQARNQDHILFAAMSSGIPLKLLNEARSHLPEELKSGQVLKEKKNVCGAS